MFLKCETILNVYEHESKTILCRVKFWPSTNNNKNENSHNTCRAISEDQWNQFDKELKSWLLRNDDKLCKEEEADFSVKPNLRFKLKKCKSGLAEFLTCIKPQKNDCDSPVDTPQVENCLPFVVDCILEHTLKSPPTPTIHIEEYEPLPTSSIENNSLSLSPLSYAPYTPSKRTRRFHSEHQVKTPGYDISGNETAEDIYTPKPIIKHASNNDVAQYNPSPIRKRRNSSSNLASSENKDIVDSEEDEQVPYNKYRRLRRKLKSKTMKNNEYIPPEPLMESPTPAYKPSPIETISSKKPEPEIKPKSNEEQCKATLEDKDKQISVSKPPKQQHKKKEKRISRERENDKRTFKEKTSSAAKESEDSSLNATVSSEDDFDSGQKKINLRRQPENEDLDKIFVKNDSPKKKDKFFSKWKIPSLSRGNGERNNNGNSAETQSRNYNKTEIDKEKKRYKHREEHTKITEKESSNQAKAEHNKELSSCIRRSERSPSKPKRFIEEQESSDILRKQKSKISQTAKELFGTDDDDDDIVRKCSDTNNNGSDKHPSLQTPKNDKKNPSHLSLSATPSSSSKQKRRREDCVQEKASMSKWLGKKSSNNSIENTSKERHASKEKSSSRSSSKDKHLKTSKSDKKEHRKPRSPSPQALAIVVPSKEELEKMRNKHKVQKEENEKMKVLLETINTPVPKKVNHLSLKNMTLRELLDSFSIYKGELDEIFEKNRKMNHVKGNDGVNHCLVISLIDQALQLKMMEKLSDVYSTNKNNTTHATLYANALLPEWIIRIFMEKFDLSRCQAIKQITDQDAYKSYMDDQSETSLLFDD